MSTYCRIVALCLAFDAAGWAAETGGFVARTYNDGKGHSLPYRLFIPAGYDASKQYPLVLYFHGAGGRGSDNLKQMTDVPRFLVLAEPANQRQWPCFILAPQCPENQQWAAMPWSEPSGVGKFTSITWPMEASLALVDSLPQEYRGIDVSRLYVTGISMGGYGTWDAVCRVPKKFKAAVPICGGGDPVKIAQVTDLKNLRVWAYHSADDRTVPAGRTREMIDALKALQGIQPRYTKFPDGGHDAYTRAYADPTLLPWLFAGDGRATEVDTRAQVQQWDLFETSFETAKPYTNPFTDVEVDVIFRQGEKHWKVPAFWAGGDTWKVRFAPPAQGQYTYRVECTDKGNTGLNGKQQTLQVAAYTGKNPLLQHGFLKVSADKRHFEHADGTPFFWLGDTWWKGLCKRLTWEGFQELTADRKAKGFSVVQLVCGTYPDEGLFQPGWENEGGKPYETRDYSVVNPSYFDYADRRIRHLVDNGILPVVVGGWGRGDCDGMAMAGLAGIKRHWRNLIARYGAYPTVWIIGGETGGAQWSEVTRYVHGLDPYDRPVTIHNPSNARTALTDEKLLDFDMLETSHDDWTAAQLTLTRLKAAYSSPGQKVMPVMVGEACYEGHMQRNWQDVQRYLFWSTLLSGSAGHTYGAAGIWHAGVEGDPGHVAGWFKEQAFDWTTWKEGMNYPGSTQLGLGKKLLEQYPWSRFAAHPEWVEGGSFAAGIPGEVRFIFLPRRNVYNWSGPEVRNLEPDVDWHVYYFDPATGRKFDQGTIKATAKAGDKDAKPVSFKKNVPSPQDWILVFERGKEPIQVHPDNPHYLLWRGKPTVLVTSGEHYGAVMNAPFDYVAYLDELQSVGLNLTRLFSGVYCEAAGDFNIKDNTLAPGPGNLLCPYARSNTPGYTNGGNKFDLTKWDEAYFKRLKDFIAQAGKRGIVVEFSFFCPYYSDSQWNLSPFNAKNNVNGADLPPIDRGNGLTHPKLLDVQQALVRKVVTELKDADNLYYEVCNEAYGVPFEWQHKIANTIVEIEKALSCKHLIAQNASPVYDAVHPAVSIFNFHPGAVNVSVRSNHGLNKLTGLDETSPLGKPLGAATTAFDYRRWGWTHLLDGGAIYNNLDYSFTVPHPKGAYQQWDEQPGGAMTAMRKQLRILKDFMEGFDFVRMKPDATLVKGGVPAGGAAYVLAKSGEAYAIYLHGGKQASLMLDVPAGRYRAEWVNTLTGNVDKSEEVTHGGGALKLSSPDYTDDVALRVKVIKP